MKFKVCQGPGCENEFEAFPSNKKYCGTTCKNRARYLGDSISDDEDVSLSLYGSAPEDSFDEPDEEDLLARMDFLRKENGRLQRAHDKRQHSVDEAFQLMLDTIAKNVKSIQVKPPKEKSNKYKAQELVLNPWNSDAQLGKVTPSYNTEVAYERIEKYTDYIIEYHKDHSGEFSITTANIWFLGDIVEGENIFPTQPHVIDTSVFRQASIDGPQIYGAQIRRLLEIVDKVKVTCVIGNHGRLGRFSNPESNMDRVLYQILYWMFENEPRVEFDIPQGHGESMFWAVDAIGKYSTLLVHGDQFGPPTTQNTYVKKIPAWRAGGIPVPFDALAMGHYHQNVKFTIGDIVVRISGSPESHNTFAQERLGVMGRPSQHLQLIDPNKGVYLENDVYLD